MRNALVLAFLSTTFAVRLISKEEGKPTLTSKGPPKFNLLGKANNPTPTVSVQPNQRKGSKSDTMLGLNVPFWNEKEFIDEYGKPAIDQSFNSIRIPGGSWANKYIWNMDFKEFPYFKDMTEITKNPNIIDTKKAVELARSTNATLLIQANYAVARVYGAEKAGKLAADWAKYIRNDLKYPLTYVEVGNENYGKWEVPFSAENGAKHYDVNGKMYGEDFNVIQRHLKQVSPSIQVGAVLSIHSGPGTRESALLDNEITKDWNKDVLTACGQKADFVTVHSYFNDEYHPLSLFSYTGFGPKAMRNMVDQQVGMYAKIKRKMPIALTEFNVQMPPRDQTVNMVNGLFTAKLLGESMENDIFMTHLWGLRTKWRKGQGAHLKVTSSGKKIQVPAAAGEYGIFSNDQPGVKKHTPRATLYTEYIFKRIFSDGRHMVKATSDADDLMVFAAAKENGDSTGMVLLNLGMQEKSVTLSGVPKTDTAKMWTLQGEGNKLDDRRFMLNQVKTSDSQAEYGGPWPLHKVQPKVVSTQKKIIVPPYSVVGVLA